MTQARYLLSVLLVATVFSLCQADPVVDAKPNVVPGLTLDEPVKYVVGQKSYVKIAAKADGAVTFDVEAQFLDADVNFEWEVLTDTTVLVAVPPSPGVIRVSAVAVVNAKPTRFAKTYIEIEAKSPNAPKPDPTPKPPAPRPALGTVHSFFILDYQKGAEAIAVTVNARTLRTQLNALGVRQHILSSTSKVIEQQDLAAYVKDAGGAPALIVTDEGGNVLWVGKVPADEVGIIAAIKKASGR